jgi:hypothetical protein
MWRIPLRAMTVRASPMLSVGASVIRSCRGVIICWTLIIGLSLPVRGALEEPDTLYKDMDVEPALIWVNGRRLAY